MPTGGAPLGWLGSSFAQQMALCGEGCRPYPAPPGTVVPQWNASGATTNGSANVAPLQLGFW